MNMKEKPQRTELEQEFEMQPMSSVLLPGPSPHKPAAEKEKTSICTYILIVLLAIIVKVLQPLAIAKSKTSDGKYRYNESTMVLLVEIVKLIFCCFVFFLQYRSTSYEKRQALYSLPFSQSFHFIVPAVLYAASNTLVYYGMSYINPALFHVFGNIRILTAGLMYRMIMKKKQTDIQWISLFLIAGGAILSSPEQESDKKNPNENYFLGLFLVVLMSACSTAASIYTEKFFKTTQDLSIFYQNIVLYLYGILVNIIVVIFMRSEEKRIFDGFDQAGFQVLAVQSAMGISLSFIFKYLDNIVYVISLTVAMFLTALLSIFFFEFNLSMEFISSLMVVTIGIYLFYRHKVFEKYKLQESDTLI